MEFGPARVDQVIAHDRNDCLDIDIVGRHEVRREWLPRRLELVAADQFGPTGSGFDREGVRDLAHLEVNIEVRRVVDSRRNVTYGVPVQQNPLERDVIPSGHAVWQGNDELVRVLAFRPSVYRAVLGAAEATMLVGNVRQTLQRARGPNDAYRRRRAAALELGVARHRSVT